MLEFSYARSEFEQAADGTQSPSGEAYVLRFDAVVSEKPVFSASLTEHPVEGGAPIADHKIGQLAKLSLSCVVTDSPLGDAPPSGSRTSRVTGSVSTIDLGQGMRAEGLVYSEEVTRVVDVLEELRDLVMRPVMVTVTTDLRPYENMQVVGVSAPRDVKGGTAIEFGIELQEMRIATVATSVAPAPRFPRNGRRVNGGSSATTTPNPNPPPGPQTRRSLASRALNLAGAQGVPVQ